MMDKEALKAAAEYLRQRTEDILHVLSGDPKVAPLMATTPIIIELGTDKVKGKRVVHEPSLRILPAEGSLKTLPMSRTTLARLRKIALQAPRMGVEEDGPDKSPVLIGIMINEPPASATLRALAAARLSSPAYREAVRETCARIDAE